MTRILFEDALALGAITFVVLLILFGVWFRTRSGLAGRILLGGVGLAIALFIVQALIQTDREKLIATVRQLSEWVSEGDIPKVIDLFAPDVQFGGGRDRDDFKAHLITLLERYDIRAATISGFEMEIQSTQAVLTCRSRCTVSTTEWTYPVVSRWELGFELAGERWRIISLKPIEIAGRRYDSVFGIH